MFFLLSKLLDFVFRPVVWVLVLLLIGLLHHNIKKRKGFIIAGIITLFFFTNDFIADEFMRLWEVPAISDQALTKKYDVGIVLGGMVAYDPTLDRLQFDRGADRVFQAIKLYKEGKIKKILLVGGSGSIVESDILEAPLLKKYFVTIGIPDSVMAIEPHSRNTHENALFAKPILDSVAHGGSYLLITSASHMPRALKCFQKVGITVSPYSTDRYSGPRKFIFDHLLIPDKWALLSWDALLHEVIGYITYKIKGYI